MSSSSTRSPMQLLLAKPWTRLAVLLSPLVDGCDLALAEWTSHVVYALHPIIATAGVLESSA